VSILQCLETLLRSSAARKVASTLAAQTDGSVERVQGTIFQLEASLARYLVLKLERAPAGIGDLP
jgi:hypothetical protein